VNTENGAAGEMARKGKERKVHPNKIIYENDYQKVLICFPPRMDPVQKFRPAL